MGLGNAQSALDSLVYYKSQHSCQRILRYHMAAPLRSLIRIWRWDGMRWAVVVKGNAVGTRIGGSGFTGADIRKVRRCRNAGQTQTHAFVGAARIAFGNLQMAYFFVS